MNQILAAIAEEEAKKNYHGNTTAAISNLQPLLSWFDRESGETLETLNERWGGAFVYHCLRLSGIELPSRYPDPRVGSSFASPAAWEAYARLPKIGLWRQNEQPEVGDVLLWSGRREGEIYTGILLRTDGEQMEIAVGDYHNHSSIVERSLELPIRGFFRM